MALSFTNTANLKKAVGCINEVDDAKFPLLLSRILGKLHLQDERTFSEEEEEKLQAALGLNESDLELVIESCEFFLHQAAYHTAKPALLAQQLTGLELHEAKVKSIVDAWTGAARDVVDKLRKKTLAPKQLESVNWRLNLQMAQQNQTKMKKPNAQLQFTVRDDPTQEREKIRVEFSHEELYDFYNQLETIQRQVDSLN